MKTGEWLVVVLIAVLVTALAGSIKTIVRAQKICEVALDRSHTAADTATVYRLNVCKGKP